MRHLGSLVLSLALAPAIVLLGASAYARILDAGHGGPNSTGQQHLTASMVWTGVAAAIAAGILYAVLLLIRLSPIGTATAGALMIMFGGCGVFRWQVLAHVLPATILGVHRPIIGVFTPFAIVLGAPLLLTAAVPSRWRRDESDWADSVPWRRRRVQPSPGYSTNLAFSDEVDEAVPWHTPHRQLVDHRDSDPWGDELWGHRR